MLQSSGWRNGKALDRGVEVILWLQRASPTLDLPFRVLTFLGGEEFFLLLLPFIYWCVDRSTGTGLFFSFFISFYIGAWAKASFNQPRPFEYDSRVEQLFVTIGRGFPSIHALAVVTLWGYLALELHHALAWVIVGALMVLIPLSRLYLGLHFPTDLVGGYVMGVVLLFLILTLGPTVETWLSELSVPWQLGTALVLPVLMLLALPAREEIGVNTTALLLGASLGFVLEAQWIHFDTGVMWEQVWRFPLGIGGLFALRFRLRALLVNQKQEMFFRFLRYASMGLWLAVGAPWVFEKLASL